LENKVTFIMTKLNWIRRENTALQQTNNIEFCGLHNDKLIGYVKWSDDRENIILTVVNLDAYYTQKGMLRLPYEALGLHSGQHVIVNELITKDVYRWESEWNYIELNPALPFHVFKIHIA